MIKLLIVDDEPLVQIGLKSMLDWSQLGIEVCATASNGKEALELIRQFSPELVITDIKMPIMNGLELAKECRDTYGSIPLFIFFTSYEEFPLIRQALACQAVDYLIKLELDADSLKASVSRALERLKELKESMAFRRQEEEGGIMAGYRDKFLMRLLYGLFDSREQFLLQLGEQDMDFSSPYSCAAYGEFYSPREAGMDEAQSAQLYRGSLHMLRDILGKYLTCHCLFLDRRHFALILCLSGTDVDKALKPAWDNALSMLPSYFSVSLSAGVGEPVSDPILLSQSFQEARQAFKRAAAPGTSGEPVAFFRAQAPDCPRDAFNMSIFRAPLSRAFEEFDADVLDATLSQIIELFCSHPLRHVQALDGALNILYLSMSMLPKGEELADQIFSGWKDSYRSIYSLTTSAQIAQWLTVLKDGLCQELKSQRRTYKNHVIANVQKYINAHIGERLTLNQVADLFSLSPNYLSSQFKKICGIGFSEYITQKKIAKAKTLLLEKDMKIYEAADVLGFENAFYFSKVFKKVEGISPREYVQLHLSAPAPVSFGEEEKGPQQSGDPNTL